MDKYQKEAKKISTELYNISKQFDEVINQLLSEVA